MVTHSNPISGVRSAITNSSLGRGNHVVVGNQDRHQNTVQNKKKLKISTWNVRAMYQNDKYENLEQDMERLQINILGISETHLKGSGKLVKEN